MKRHKPFSLTFAKGILFFVLVFGVFYNAPLVVAQKAVATCNDGLDNDGDKRADWAGATISGESYPPDPSCINRDGTEVPDATGTGIIPCHNKCDLNSVLALINNLIDFLITDVLLVIIIIMFIYAGFKYVTSQGNPGKTANLKGMIGHIVGGLVIILCAWLVVKTILVVLGYKDALLFFS